MTENEALDLLASCYALEVKNRKGDAVFDQNTESNLLQLAKYLTQEVPKFGVLLCGTCGNGKTTLMYAFQRALNYLNGIRHFKFMDDYFKAAMEIYDAKELLQMSTDLKEWRRVKGQSMLGIDDLGKEATEIMNYGTVSSPIVDLIEHRYNRQLFTFITTNLKPKDVKAKYGARIADRFNEMLHVIVFSDISYRRKE